jgi:hypothetical protein
MKAAALVVSSDSHRNDEDIMFPGKSPFILIGSLDIGSGGYANNLKSRTFKPARSV